MIDIVFPQGNEEDFVKKAIAMGIGELIFAYNDIKPRSPAFDLKSRAAVLSAPDKVLKFRGKVLTICKAPEDQSMLRGLIERSPDVIYGLEFISKKDFFHHRASGLNHVLAVLAEEHGVAIGLDYSNLILAEPRQRALYLGRMAQNIRLAKRFKFKVVIGSFAADPMLLRSEKDVASLFRNLGMDDVMLRGALGWKLD